jgi:hypothetical protein
VKQVPYNPKLPTVPAGQVSRRCQMKLSNVEALALRSLSQITEGLAVGKWAEVRDAAIRLAALASDKAGK